MAPTTRQQTEATSQAGRSQSTENRNDDNGESPSNRRQSSRTVAHTQQTRARDRFDEETPPPQSENDLELLEQQVQEEEEESSRLEAERVDEFTRNQRKEGLLARRAAAQERRRILETDDFLDNLRQPATATPSARRATQEDNHGEELRRGRSVAPQTAFPRATV